MENPITRSLLMGLLAAALMLTGFGIFWWVLDLIYSSWGVVLAIGTILWASGAWIHYRAHDEWFESPRVKIIFDTNYDDEDEED